MWRKMMSEYGEFEAEFMELKQRVLDLEKRLKRSQEDEVKQNLPHCRYGPNVYRYFRPSSDHPQSNLGGATVLFDFDYTSRTIDVYMALCRDDENFNKEIGRSLCNTRRLSYDSLPVIILPIPLLEVKPCLKDHLTESVLRNTPFIEWPSQLKKLVTKRYNGEWV
jgi:hypothetical protein